MGPGSARGADGPRCGWLDPGAMVKGVLSPPRAEAKGEERRMAGIASDGSADRDESLLSP